MSSLQNQKIKNTYPGLIKTENNSAIGSTASRLTDGLGNNLPLTIDTEGVYFDGVVDFTGATVNGISGGGSVGFSSTISGSTITGSINETISRSVLIPANTFTNGDWIELRELTQKSGTSGTATTRVYLNTTNSLSNALIISTISIVPSAAVSINSIRNILVKSTNSLVINPTTSSSNYNDWTQTTTTSNTLTSVSIDWSVDQYLIFTAQLTNSGDSIFNSGYVFRKI